MELAGRSGCVISTGGRFMLDEHNASVLTPTSDVFALVAEPEEIARRVLDGIATRPLLADAEDPVRRIKDMVEQRRAGYARFATVTTDGRNRTTLWRSCREGAADGTGASPAWRPPSSRRRRWSQCSRGGAEKYSKS